MTLLFESMKMRENLQFRLAQERMAKAQRTQDPKYTQQPTEQATKIRTFKYHNDQDTNGPQQPLNATSEKLVVETEPRSEQPVKKLPIRTRSDAEQGGIESSSTNANDDADDDYVLLEDPRDLVVEL